MLSHLIASAITFVLGVMAGYFLEQIIGFGASKVRHMLKWLFSRPRTRYEKTLNSADFVAFQTRALKDYYGPEYFTNVFGQEYPVYCIPGQGCYPFADFCVLPLGDDKKFPICHNRTSRKYRSLVSPNIRRPKMQGFMLENFRWEKDRITGVQAWTGTYEQNVYTSHVLEYELYQAYRKKQRGATRLSLPLRDAIQAGHTAREVLQTGCNRASLLGVQLLIVFKNARDGAYRVLTIKRSEDVAARPGFYQFVPSGGFEVYENSDEHDPLELRENYNVLWAIYREYMEELILGKGNDYEYGQGGETVSKIEREDAVKDIEQMIQAGTAQFVFLGSVIDLCGLRHELSFALKIDDPAYSERTFHSNSESKKINRYTLDELKVLDRSKINPASAGLWHLFEKSSLYREILSEG